MPYASLFTSTHWMAASTLLTLEVPSAPDRPLALSVVAPTTSWYTDRAPDVGGTSCGSTTASADTTRTAAFDESAPIAFCGIDAAKPPTIGRFAVTVPPKLASASRAVG